MVDGYFEIDNLLNKLNNEEFFSNIFKRHFVYWLTSLVASDISDTEKRELVAAINPLLRKQVNITSDFDERIYSPLTKPILAGDYDETVRKITKIKKSRARKDKTSLFLDWD